MLIKVPVEKDAREGRTETGLKIAEPLRQLVAGFALLILAMAVGRLDAQKPPAPQTLTINRIAEDSTKGCLAALRGIQREPVSPLSGLLLTQAKLRQPPELLKYGASTPPPAGKRSLYLQAI